MSICASTILKHGAACLANRSDRLFGVVAFVFLSFAVVWIFLFSFFPDLGQDSLFFCKAKSNYCYDFFVPRAVARMSAPYVQDTFSNEIDTQCVKRVIQCYPALLNYWVGLFPESLGGAISCAFIGVVIFVLGLFAFFERYIPERSFLAVSLVCCSAPFLFAVTVGNLILYAVGFTMVFLAWYDSTSRWRKMVASLAIAVAAVSKITPALLGLLYLGRGCGNRVKYLILSVVAAVLMFVIPFCFCGGMTAWFENAISMNNSGQFVNRNGFGWFGLVRVLAISFTMSDIPCSALRTLRFFSSCFGIFVLMMGCLGKETWTRGCGTVLGMLMIPPTMMEYTALYVIPFLLVGVCHECDAIRKISMIYFLSLGAPLLIPLFLGPIGSFNVCVAAAASIGMAIAVSYLSFQDLKKQR